MARRQGLGDDQWARIAPLLPGRAGQVGGTARDNRRFAEAVLYRYRTGVPWRALPERFGEWQDGHRRFSRWAARGVWERSFKALSADADDEDALLDATIVRARRHRAGARTGGATARHAGAAGAGCARSGTRWSTRSATRPPST